MDFYIFDLKNAMVSVTSLTKKNSNINSFDDAQTSVNKLNKISIWINTNVKGCPTVIIYCEILSLKLTPWYLIPQEPASLNIFISWHHPIPIIMDAARGWCSWSCSCLQCLHHACTMPWEHKPLQYDPPDLPWPPAGHSMPFTQWMSHALSKLRPVFLFALGLSGHSRPALICLLSLTCPQWLALPKLFSLIWSPRLTGLPSPCDCRSVSPWLTLSCSHLLDLLDLSLMACSS